MNEHQLRLLLEDRKLLDTQIHDFLTSGILKRQDPDTSEIQGHMDKAQNNLRFVNENIRLGYLDWSIAGCYYACYHAALSLILTKGLSSKNHVATLCALIKEFYGTTLTREDIETVSSLLDYQDVLFYVESKQRREEATYSTRTKYAKRDVEQLKLKAALFVAKTREILLG